MTKLIDTRTQSELLRSRAIDLENKKILISRLSGSGQEVDISEPINCDGYGRIRHFKFEASDGWPSNPLPGAPAANALGVRFDPLARAQVFQNAACNWRCWYCFVPYNLLAADPRRSKWMSADELVTGYLDQDDRPHIIDLSGGSPDMVPEWTVWMMEALTAAGIHDQVYLWSDDNLSTEYLFNMLSNSEIETMAGYRNYGRVCCFKGFDEQSFVFNTTAKPDAWPNQFNIARQLLDLGLDLYGYVTLTTPGRSMIEDGMPMFFDRLQILHEYLPLRIVPLEIKAFSPTIDRLNEDRRAAIENQWIAIDAWNEEIEKRFGTADRELPIFNSKLGTR